MNSKKINTWRHGQKRPAAFALLRVPLALTAEGYKPPRPKRSREEFGFPPLHSKSVAKTYYATVIATRNSAWRFLRRLTDIRQHRHSA